MFNLANLFTSANLISGVFAIILSFTGNIHLAVFSIFLGAIFDFLDGFFARIFNTSGELGKQLDSLADMVTFGVAPGVLMMVVLASDLSISNFSIEKTQLDFLTWINDLLSFKSADVLVPLAGLIIPFFSLFRLAKFNLDTRQTSSFIGLPTPANTLFFTTFPLVLVYGSADTSWLTSLLFNPLVIISLICLLGLLMVSEIPLFSLKIKGARWKGNETRLIFLLISLIFIFVFKVWAIAIIVLLYLMMSIIENTFIKSKESNEI